MKVLAFCAASSCLALFAMILAAPARAADHVNLVNGLALRGYDPVAFPTQGKAVRGDPKFTAKFDGATYEFVDAKEKAAFDAEPVRYVPQYGGFCSAATSEGDKNDTNPRAFAITYGKLCVNYTVSG